MKLRPLVKKYVEFKRALGYKFETDEKVLLFFIKTIGPAIELKNIKLQQVSIFLDGTGPLTRNWHRKYTILMGLFKYATRMNYLSKIPLPSVVPKQTQLQYLIPYIYSHNEIKKLLEATNTFQKQRVLIEPITTRTFIILLYGAGLRGHEAVSLTIGDVELKNRLITIREGKCKKSRLVPIGKQLTEELLRYSKYRAKVYPRSDKKSPFFISNTGKKLKLATIRSMFNRLRKHAGVYRIDGAKYQPRLHDLRHTFAVHRLITWYEQGEDVTRLLHHLSVYLGHVCLADTQVYLTMTPQLLNEANIRFQNYVLKGIRNEKK